MTPPARSSSAPTATPARTAAASTRRSRSSTSSSSAPLDPLLAERRAAFKNKADALQSDRRKKEERLAELRRLDPAQAALDLKILDPAMGSGHFLVTAVDYLSDAIAELVEYAPTAAPWLHDLYTSRYSTVSPPSAATSRPRPRFQLGHRRSPAYRPGHHPPPWFSSAASTASTRTRSPSSLPKSPLWLHSFTVGAPLSFLDHHLRCGDSLVGLRVHDATRELARLGGFTSSSAVQAAENATQGMQRIEELSDADISEVEESANLFAEVEKTTAPLRGLLDTFCGMHCSAPP